MQYFYKRREWEIILHWVFFLQFLVSYWSHSFRAGVEVTILVFGRSFSFVSSDGPILPLQMMRMMIEWGCRSILGVKPASVVLCPQQVPHGLLWDRIRAFTRVEWLGDDKNTLYCPKLDSNPQSCALTRIVPRFHDTSHIWVNSS